METLLRVLFLWLWPQKVPPDSDAAHAWRQSVAVVLYILLGANVLQFLLSFGFLSVFGFTGFASAADVTKQLKDNYNATENMKREFAQRFDSADARNLMTLILMLRTRQCAAQKDGRLGDAEDFRLRILQSISEYQKVSGGMAFPPLDPC